MNASKDEVGKPVDHSVLTLTIPKSNFAKRPLPFLDKTPHLVGEGIKRKNLHSLRQ